MNAVCNFHTLFFPNCTLATAANGPCACAISASSTLCVIHNFTWWNSSGADRSKSCGIGWTGPATCTQSERVIAFYTDWWICARFASLINCGPHAKHEIIVVGSATPNALGRPLLYISNLQCRTRSEQNLSSSVCVDICVFWEAAAAESAARRESIKCIHRTSRSWESAKRSAKVHDRIKFIAIRERASECGADRNLQ